MQSLTGDETGLRHFNRSIHTQAEKLCKVASLLKLREAPLWHHHFVPFQPLIMEFGAVHHVYFKFKYTTISSAKLNTEHLSLQLHTLCSNVYCMFALRPLMKHKRWKKGNSRLAAYNVVVIILLKLFSHVAVCKTKATPTY